MSYQFTFCLWSWTIVTLNQADFDSICMNQLITVEYTKLDQIKEDKVFYVSHDSCIYLDVDNIVVLTKCSIEIGRHVSSATEFLR